MNKLKLFVLFSIFCLAIVMPLSYAADNVTVVAADSAVQNGTLESIDSDNILTVNVYYFDSSIENDTGDGSINNPFRDLKNERMKEGYTLYLADGEYELDTFRSVSSLTIIGSNPLNTTVKFDKYRQALQSSTSLTLKNVTFVGFSIKTTGNLHATNVVFEDNYLGAIVSQTKKSSVTLDNCTFRDNYATNGGAINVNGGNILINNSQFIGNHASKGGAIYIDNGFLTIENSIFAYNYATLYGGSIFSQEEASVIIRKSKFLNGYSGDEAGAVYLVESSLKANDLEITNSSSSFGGALVSLDSTLTLNNFTAQNNSATYYGGAVFAMYNEFSISNSTLINNSASVGGALYVSAVDTFLIKSNTFINNTADAIYSLGSDTYYDSILDKRLNNTFINNTVFESEIPDLFIGDGNCSIIQNNCSYTENLPRSYDLRNYGYVTPVKDQGKGGNCWAFSALGALESCLAKATGTYYDLSEDNMKNLMSFYSDYGWVMEPNVGGYDKMAIGYLVSWLGPVNESSDEYRVSSLLSPVLNSLFHIQNILFLTRTSYTDNDAIKKAIMNYGGVSTSIYWSNQYLNGKNYYNNKATSANHAIVIVGWDDTYSRENFLSKPAGDGAWIIKNSWGESGGDNGFYYVSYYDIKCAPLNNPLSTYTFILNDSIKYDKNYQYDIPGKTDFFLNTSSTVWYKNKFTATGNEYLVAVSTYFEKDTAWQISVYVNNALKLTQSGSSNPGYWTIDLDQMIHLNQGDVFEVVFKITVKGDAGVPISEKISLNYELYKKGISYISYNGKNWVDLYELEWTYPDHVYDSQVACIKAFTIFDKLDAQVNLTIVNDYNPVGIEARVYNQYGKLVNSGNIVFVLENTSVKVKIQNGVAKLNYIFKELNNNSVTAIFTAEGYNGNSSTVTTDAKEVFLFADNLTDYAVNVRYSANLKDKYDNPVSDKEIKFTINNRVYTAFTDKNGVASIDMTLDAGSYDIEIAFVEASGNYFNLTRKIKVLTTITLDSNTRFTYNSYYCAKLLDENGKALANKKVNIIIGSTISTTSTDSKGNAKYNIKSSVGSYKLSVVNLQSGEVKSHTIKVVARLSGNSDVTMYYGAGKYYKVRAFDDYGNIAKGVEVVFKFNGKTYSRYTNSQGYASLKLSGQPNTYTITAAYKGFKVSNRIVIKPTLIMKDKTVKRNKVFAYYAKLLNSQGKILKNKAITLKFRGVTYKAKTNANGIAKFSIKSLSKTGKFNIGAVYGNARTIKVITVKK